MSAFRRFRSKRAPNPPVAFIENHIADDLSPRMVEPPLQYATELDTFVTPDEKERVESQENALFDGAKIELQQLREAVLHYQQKTNPESQPLVDVQVCTWTQVLKEVEVAKARETARDEESWTIRGFCNKIKENAAVFEAWLNLLPSGDYGAVVSGVFGLVIGAMQRANEVRLTIYKTLADIPELITRAADYRLIYENQKPVVLVRRTAELCSAILIALRLVIHYFTEGTLRKALGAFFKGPSYKQSLLDQLDLVRDLTKKIDEQADRGDRYRLLNVENNVAEILEQFRMHKAVGQQQPRPDDGWKQDLTDSIAKCVVNGVYSLLASNPQFRNDGVPPPPQQEIQAQVGSEKPTQIETEEVFSLLKYSEDLPERDLGRCIANGRSLSLADQDYIKWAMQSHHFQRWLSYPKSRVLQINGNADTSETFSPMTILAATLLETIKKIKPIATVHFFCSLHTSSTREIEANAAGMLKSLIGQLLLRGLAWDLAYLDDQNIEKIENNDIEVLVGLFHELIKQLPDATFLFWVIDGITFYERSDKREDFLAAIDQLLEVMEDCDKLTIKLLLTCPGTSAFIKYYVDEDDILYLPSESYGDLQDWSKQAWDRKVGSELRKTILDH